MPKHAGDPCIVRFFSVSIAFLQRFLSFFSQWKLQGRSLRSSLVLLRESPYSVISNGADSVASQGGSCNLIAVQMFSENPADSIEASCQTVGEWNLVCFACECVKGVVVFRSLWWFSVWSAGWNLNWKDSVTKKSGSVESKNIKQQQKECILSFTCAPGVQHLVMSSRGLTSQPWKLQPGVGAWMLKPSSANKLRFRCLKFKLQCELKRQTNQIPQQVARHSAHQGCRADENALEKNHDKDFQVIKVL